MTASTNLQKNLYELSAIKTVYIKYASKMGLSACFNYKSLQ